MRRIALFLLLIAASAQGSVINDRQTLIEAIEAVQAQGFTINWSNRLVKPWMRVRSTPISTTPLESLAEALTPYALTLESGPGEHWLIVEGRPMDPESRPTLLPAPAASAAAAPQKPRLDEIRIVASRYSLFDRNAASDQFLTGEEIRVMPHIADDAFRAFHRLPGAAASDFSAPFNLRGGAVEEVKVVLDGLELFEPYHLRTLFSPLSIVDPGIIDTAHVLSGGFTAENGNHLSGVIDIHSRWPDSKPVHELGVSFINSFFRSSGTVGEDGIYQVALRRGYLDLLADTVTDDGEELSPRYSDVFAKFGYLLSDTTTLTAQLLHASDQVDFVDPGDETELRGDSDLTYAWLTLDAEPGDRIHWRNIVSIGAVSNEELGQDRGFALERIDRSFKRNVDVAAWQSDLSYRVGDDRFWNAGVRYRRFDADWDYHIDSLRQTSFVNSGEPFALVRDIVTARDGEELGVYGRYRFRVSPSATFELGLRWDKQTWIENGSETQFSPRINALFRASDRTDLRLGWGLYHQPQSIQDLQVIDGVTNYFPAEQAEQFVLGLQHRFRSNIELHADVYLKDYEDLRPRFENVLDTYEFAAESNFDRIRIEPSGAEASGIELVLRNRNEDRFTWWLNYTWSRAEDTIGRVSVPRSWDQRHALTANLTWRGERWMLSMVGRWRSGWPRTPLLVESIIDQGGNLIEIDSDLSQRNSSKYADYFRVDLRLSRTIKLERGSFQYYFEIFNVFNYENECCVPDHDLDLGGPVITVQPNIDDFLPFFPSFGFVWTFGPGAD